MRRPKSCSDSAEQNDGDKNDEHGNNDDHRGMMTIKGMAWGRMRGGLRIEGAGMESKVGEWDGGSYHPFTGHLTSH